ncbi:MAG: hypothetical protein HFG04_01255 [Oscillibacter sp.]|jgi:hypothetical protein|nr:hypothetical protein [Oscillibacter sp.]MCI9003488.1 hypothetical protein [Oscillibacter sp.]
MGQRQRGEAWELRFRLSELAWVALQLLTGIRNYRSGGPAFYDSWTWVLLAAYFAALLGLDLSSLYYGEAKAVRRQKIFWLAGVVLTAIGGGLLLKNLPGRFLLVLTPFYAVAPLFTSLLHLQLDLPLEDALLRCALAALLLSGAHLLYFGFLARRAAGRKDLCSPKA